MYYSSIGILALLLHVIINFDALIWNHRKEIIPSYRVYRNFLRCVAIFYIVDALWGGFYYLKWTTVNYVDTEMYFVVMAVAVFLWSRYVGIYLNSRNKFSVLLKYTGWAFFIFQIIILVLNFFWPIVFHFDADGAYYPGNARYLNLCIQVLMFLTTTVYTLFVIVKTRGKVRRRHLTVGLFGLAMTIFVILQALYPLMPFYTIGYMLGTACLHAFVLEDEKDVRREEVERLMRVEEIQEAELGSARQMAYTDSLTGLKNASSYQEDIIGINLRIEDGILADFGIAVFDVNGLKEVNDTKGHEEGNQYIKSASDIITRIFADCPTYRIGGDEFVVFLFGEDFKNRASLMEAFERQNEKNISEGKVVISCGYAEFSPEHDQNYLQIFERADMKMYERKRMLKNRDGAAQ